MKSKKNHLCGILGTILLLTSICLHTAINKLPFSASGVGVPTKLAVYTGPLQVPADNKVYDSIFVQLQDASNKPARAPEDISVSLSSSDTAVGSVDPTLTIHQGDTYAVAKFYSTYTPGTTTITAVVSGYTAGQKAITTVGPVPTKLALYGFPPVLPTNGSFPNALIIQLQDTSGLPAKAPIGDVNVTLSSSSTAVGNVSSSVTIPSGSTYTATTFNSTLTAGSTTITAVASGYTSGQVTMTTQNLTYSGPPSKLGVHVGPPKVPAEGETYESIVIQLQDSTGKIASAVNNQTIILSSSNIAVGTTEPTVNVTTGNTYAVTKFYSTYKSGSTTITAIASDYTSGQASMTTVGPVPSKLAIYCVPPSLPADGDSYDAVFVQLQDSSGRPARDPVRDVGIILSSSKTEVGNVSASMIIPFRETYSVTSFNTTYTAGSTTITAIAAGYTFGQAAMTTYVIDIFALTVTVTANPTSVNPGGNVTIKVHVTYGSGIGVPGATITLTSDGVGSFSSIREEGNGYYNSTFTAPTIVPTQPIITISATASKPGYTSGQGTVQVTVGPPDRGNIHLYVKDASNNPISGARVTSTTQPSDQAALNSTTDSEGLVTFNNVLAGSYTLEVVKTGYRTESKSIVVDATQTTTDTINLSMNVGSIHLYVKDSSNNTLSGARVASITQPVGQLTLNSTTDTEGSVTFENVVAGNYTFEIVKTGYNTKIKFFTVTAAHTTTDTIHLDASASAPAMLPLILIAIAAGGIIAAALIAWWVSTKKKRPRPPELAQSSTLKPPATFP